MADPAIGAFGAIAVGAVLLLRFAALATQPPSVFALAGLWCASRTLMVTLTKFLPYARPDGLVQDFLGDQETRRQRWATFTSIVFGLLLSGTFLVIAKGAKGLGALAGELVAMALVGALSSRRIDGYTGDVLGAAGVIGETVGLLILVTR
jgi:adenosylcobinamide-GDP ribazoletransferase